MDPCAYLPKWPCLKQSSCAYTFERGQRDLKSILLYRSFFRSIISVFVPWLFLQRSLLLSLTRYCARFNDLNLSVWPRLAFVVFLFCFTAYDSWQESRASCRGCLSFRDLAWFSACLFAFFQLYSAQFRDYSFVVFFQPYCPFLRRFSQFPCVLL